MNNKTKIAAVLLIAGFCGWFYYTPYIAYRSLRSAADARDGDKLARYADLPAVRDSIRTAFATSLLAAGARKSGNPTPRPVTPGMLALFNAQADTMTTPAGLAVMSKGGGPDSIIELTASNANVQTSVAYEGFDQAVVNTVYRTRQNPAPIGLVFRREGLFWWKLVAMRLPLGA